MSGYPFEFSHKGKVDYITYAVGNPMGAYSSWASFALTNHYLVFFCCRTLGIEFSSISYALLGDDIVIAHREVAEAYILVVKSLGVEISALKSHISTDLYEFAKR
jgi:hypothetical protein